VAVAVGQNLTAAASGVPIPLPLRPFATSRSLRDSHDSPSFATLASGVGHDEDALSSVGRSDVCGGNPQGARSVSEHVQLVSDRTQPFTRTRRDVFDDDEARADLPDDAGEVVPEAGSRAAEPSALSGSADVLAREPSANKVNVRPASRGSDILEPLDVGPVLRQHRTAERVQLALPEHRTEAGPFEAELKAADPRE
jgi:hypothetical protein